MANKKEKEILAKIAQAVAEGDEDDAVGLVNEAFALGIDPMTVLNEGAGRGMDQISEDYNNGDAFLPELVLAGDAMTAVNEIIFAEIAKSGSNGQKMGVIVIGQAKGDVHDIGKNVVSALLACNGFEVHDLGIDVPVKKFFDTALEVKADIVAMSTLLTTSLPFMDDTLRYIADTGNRNKMFYILGGGPVAPEFAAKVGADGWSRTAFDCVELCKQLMAKGNPGTDPIILVDSES